MSIRILVIEDEPDLQDILRFNLRSDGYEIDTVGSAEEALELNLAIYDLFLLDVMMSKMSGYKLADLIRSDQKLSTPIIFLTARDGENDMLTGFSLGADDYIKKPFSIVELKARIKAVLARTVVASESEIIAIGSLTLDIIRKEVKVNKRVVELTKKEYQILEILMKNSGIYVAREELLNTLWQETVVTDRTVDVHIARLRKRLGDFGQRIKSRSGYGYFIESENDNNNDKDLF